MKNSLKTLALVPLFALAASAQAALFPLSGTVELENTSYDGGTGSYNIDGGEYKATIAGYTPFYTFCVEMNEGIVFGTPLDYTVSPYADSQGDHISKGTAYLFELFVKGKLYDRTLDALHDEAAGYMQAAIWILDDEDFSGKSGLAKAKFFNIATNPFIGKVIDVFGSLVAAKVDDDKGKVKVMNLTLNDARHQDVLIYVPDTGSTFALLGLALGCVALASRRNRATPSR